MYGKIEEEKEESHYGHRESRLRHSRAGTGTRLRDKTGLATCGPESWPPAIWPIYQLVRVDKQAKQWKNTGAFRHDVRLVECSCTETSKTVPCRQ